LPDDKAMAERQKAGRKLTRPEIALLLAYAKIALNADLLQSDLADDPALESDLVRYFPKKMTASYGEAIGHHRLRREIIATDVANSMINRGGPTFLRRMGERTGALPPAVARAYVAVRAAFALRDLNEAVDALDGKVGGSVQLDLYRAAQDLLLSRTAWFLRNVSFAGGIAPVIDAYGATVAAVGGTLGKILPAHIAQAVKAEADALVAAGVPSALALRVARLPALSCAADIHLVAASAATEVTRAAVVFFAVDDHFQIARVAALAGRLSTADYADGLALDRALETLADAHRRIAIDALAADGDGERPLDAWLAARSDDAVRVLETTGALVSGETPTVSRVTVAAGLLADLARTMH
jgi:glutamate dehydrogenase